MLDRILEQRKDIRSILKKLKKAWALVHKNASKLFH